MKKSKLTRKSAEFRNTNRSSKFHRVDANKEDAAVTYSRIVRWPTRTKPSDALDALTREEPLEIRVRGKSVAVTMRTPGNDAELAAGFLLSEGLIHSKRDVVNISHCQTGDVDARSNIINVFLRPEVPIDFAKLTRHVYASSSCGICGKASIESVHQHFAPITAKALIKADLLTQLPDRLRTVQEAFAQTGGLHAAAIFNTTGKLLVIREDVGRHNAVDKATGYALMKGQIPLSKQVLLVSGRASFEIMQKALAAQIPIVAAISAPSSLAVEFARESGQTLIGFLRGKSMNIYAGDERIVRK